MRHEIDREQLDGWAGPDAIETRLAAQLEECHPRDRKSNGQRLAHLDKTMTIMALQDEVSDA